jgi:hypothetical protein
MKKWLVTYIPLIALVGSLLFNYIQYSQNQTQIEENRQQRIQLDSIQYVENGLTFRPRLELLNDPTIKKWHVSFNKEVFNPFFTPDSIVNDTIGTAKGSITATAIFNLINKSDAIAKIQFQSLVDTFTSAPILRTRLLNAIETNKIKVEYADDYSKLDLGKDDSTTIEIETKINYLKDDEVNLHFLLIYENEFGHLYDLYVWAVFDNIPLNFRPKIEYDEKTNRIYGTLEPEKKQNEYRCKILNSEPNFYDKNTANKIKKFFDELNDKATEDKDSIKTSI